MNAKNVNEILDALGARFGATGAHLWAVLVRQVYVDAITNTLGAIALIVGAVIAYRMVRKNWEAIDEVGAGFAVVGCLLLAGGALFQSLDAITHIGQLANPEYGALQTILGALHK